MTTQGKPRAGTSGPREDVRIFDCIPRDGEDGQFKVFNYRHLASEIASETPPHLITPPPELSQSETYTGELDKKRLRAEMRAEWEMRKADRFRLIKGRQSEDEREGFKEEPGAHPSLNGESSEERICALDKGIARPPQKPDPAALPPDMETHGATMAMVMDWSPSFCLACDRQTDGAVFCSEACRQAEYEAAERKTSPYLNPEFLAASLRMRSKSKKQFRAENRKGAVSVLRSDEEMGTSSYGSLEVLPVSLHLPILVQCHC
jgi:hypothetical protein